MRSTAFAFLGLTAALGLALVAIFAQLSFPVLSPAPPPAGPAGQSSVAEAVALHRSRAGLVPGMAQGQAAGAGIRNGGRPGDGGASTQHADKAAGAVGSPLAVDPPQSGGGEVDGESATPPPATTVPPSSPAPDAAVVTTTQPSPGPSPAPEKPQPQPASSKPSKAAVKPAKTKPEKAEAKADAKAAKVEAKAVQAESKAPTPEAAPESPSKPSATAPPEPSPGKGNGKALGHYK
jgi:hypothetical protein